MAKDRNRLFIAIANIGPTTGIDDKLVRERNNKLKSLANGSDPEAAFAYGVDYILHGLEFPSLTNAKYVYAHTAEAYAQIRPIIRKNEQNNRSLTELEKDLNERWGVQVALDLESEEELGRIGWELFDQIARTFPLLKKLNKHTPG